jgi:hypothetical protein
MDEQEYLDGEPQDNSNEDEDFSEYLADEEDNLTLVMLPKLEIDEELEVDRFYKRFKLCRNKAQVQTVIRELMAYVSTTALLVHEIAYLQERAKDLEHNVYMLHQSR